MKKVKLESKSTPSGKNIKDFYRNRSLLDLTKRESEIRIMQNQLFKVTGGKNIIFSNKGQ